MVYKALAVLFGAAAAFVIFSFVVVKMSAKGKDASGTLKKVETGLSYAQAIAAAISPFLPNMADDLIAAVLKYAQQAVTNAENAYKAALATGVIAQDTRSAEATQFVKSALAVDGVQDTPEIDKLISTVIPLLVLALPKTHSTAEQNAAGDSSK